MAVDPLSQQQKTIERIREVCEITERLEPWDLEQLVPYREEYLSGFQSEMYQIDLEPGFKRAREIIGGAAPLIDTKETKPLSIAIEEINRGLITYSRNEDDEEEKL